MTLFFLSCLNVLEFKTIGGGRLVFFLGLRLFCLYLLFFFIYFNLGTKSKLFANASNEGIMQELDLKRSFKLFKFIIFFIIFFIVLVYLKKF